MTHELLVTLPELGAAVTARPGRLWVRVQACLRVRDRRALRSFPSLCKGSWSRATLVEIARIDGGANYHAPGAYRVRTRFGDVYRVIVTAR